MADTIHESFRETARRYAGKTALRQRRRGQFVSMTYAELEQWVDSVAAKLASLGVGKGDTVGILSHNRPQWAIADLAALSLGAAVVPLYPTLPPSYLQYIINDSRMSVLVAGDAVLLTSISGVVDETPALKQTLLLDDGAIESGSAGFSSDAAAAAESGTAGPAPGAATSAAGKEPVRVEYPRVAGDDVATIVYTSGTTGAPKGVILTHSNIIANVRALTSRYGICAGDSTVSYLPLSHMFERTCGYYTFLLAGATITYAEQMSTVAADVGAARPTVLIAVPRVLEKAHAAARWRIEGHSRAKKALVLSAIRALNERANRRYRGERVSPWLALRCAVYDRLVAKKFRDAAGGRLRLIVSGGASLNKKVGKILLDIGFNIVEGYGMTEASPVIACSPVDDIRLGTVGTPLDGVEVRIGESDEILVRGPNVMRGYLNRPEETAQALDADGWLHTGDQGRLDEDGYLSITGRLKDLIVTSYGKNISPRPIEERLTNSRFIAQAMVYGDDRKHLVALIVPDRDALVQYAGEHSVPFDGYGELLRRDEIRSLLQSEIDSANERAPSYERIRAFDTLEEAFTLENGMLTPTLKPRRGRISMIHKDLIDALYAKLEAPVSERAEKKPGAAGRAGGAA